MRNDAEYHRGARMSRAGREPMENGAYMIRTRTGFQPFPVAGNGFPRREKIKRLRPPETCL
jgi:hypothetical protein